MSAQLASALVASLDDRALDHLAELLAPRLAPPAEVTPWRNVDQAAAYIQARPRRLYDLVAAGALRPARDGKRLLFHVDELDAYLLRADAQ